MNVSSTNFDLTCRCCVARETNHINNTLKLQPIYATSSLESISSYINIAELLMKTTPQIVISPTDGLSQEICKSCLDKLLELHKFQEMCLESEKNMRSQIFDNTAVAIKEEEALDLEEDTNWEDLTKTALVNDNSSLEELYSANLCKAEFESNSAGEEIDKKKISCSDLFNMDSGKILEDSEIAQYGNNNQSNISDSKKILQKLDQNTTELVALRSEISCIKAKIFGYVQKPKEVLPVEPLKTLTDFENFEVSLQQETVFKNVISELLTSGEKVFDKFVRSSWRCIVVDEVAKQFSWRGTEAKKCIRGLRITLAIRIAFKQKFGLGDGEFDRVTQKYFQYAQDRIGKAQKVRKVERNT